MGHVVAQLVEALLYKSEGRGFDSQLCHWNSSFTSSFWPHRDPGVSSASKRNEYQEYFLVGKGGRCVALTILAASFADCLEIWESQPPGTLRVCPGLYRDCSTFIYLSLPADMICSLVHFLSNLLFNDEQVLRIALGYFRLTWWCKNLLSSQMLHST